MPRRRALAPVLALVLLAGCAAPGRSGAPRLRVLTFNVLQGAGDASNVGFHESEFAGSREEAVARAIRASGADVVGVQEDDGGDGLLVALGGGWQRAGNVYARHPVELLASDGPATVARVTPARGPALVVVNVHWRPYPYGPYDLRDHLRAGGSIDDPGLAERVVAGSAKPEGARGYGRTLELLRPHVAAGDAVVLTGDFNEPSHLDWTARYAAEGADRWVDNPTGTPLRLAVRWPGSLLLAELGLRDAYRIVHPDEVAAPGDTWTPPYADGSEGRIPWGDQVLDRIDRVYVAGPLRVVDATVLGERTTAPARWPSDHRAVLVTLE